MCALAQTTQGLIPREPSAPTRIFTDAAVQYADKIGAWAVVIEDDEATRTLCGIMNTNSTSTAELRAGVEALRALPEGAGLLASIPRVPSLMISP